MMKTSSKRIVHRASSHATDYRKEPAAEGCRGSVNNRARGYTLIEVLITVSIIAALAIATLPVLSGKVNTENLLVEAIGRVRMRRLEARPLRPLGAPTAHEGWTQPPIMMDFHRLQPPAPFTNAW